VKATYPIGIDISDYSIEMLQLGRGGEAAAYGRTVLEEGVVENGDILKEEELAERLGALFAEIKPSLILPEQGAPEAVLSLPESKVFIYHFELEEDLSGDALRRRGLKEVSRVVPLRQEEMVWDFKMIPSSTTTPTVLCAGTPKAVADEYRAAAERAGFKPAVLDLETASLGRALLDPDAVAQTSSAIMDIGARTTTVSIFDEERVLRLSIIISVGGEEFTRAVALGLSLREEEAEEQKKKFGFGKGAKKNPVLPILSQEFQDVVQEVKEFIGYYEKKTGKRVGEIVLAGGSALLPSVDAFLAGQIGRDVRIGNPFARLAGGKNAGKEDRPVLFANVIGLALRGERQTSADINLLAETREAKKTTFAIPAFSRLRFSMPRLSLSSLKKRLSGVSLTRTHAVIIALLAIALGAWSFLAARQDAAVPTTEMVAEESAPVKTASVKDDFTGGLNVRGGPGTSYPILFTAYAGEKFIYLEEKDNWYKIKIDETTEGWVSSQYINLE